MNYVGVAETLGITGSAQAAGLAADNLLCAAYFATLFHLARHIPADSQEASKGLSHLWQYNLLIASYNVIGTASAYGLLPTFASLLSQAYIWHFTLLRALLKGPLETYRQ